MSVHIVHNRILGGWFVVRGRHDTPISTRFDSLLKRYQKGAV